MKATAPTHMMAGGAVFLGYQLVFDTLRHHDETNLRPMFLDHCFALGLIGAATGAINGGLPRHIIGGALLGGWMVAPMLWWFKLNGKFGSTNRPANIFYEDDATSEEIERFRHQDQVEILAHQMNALPGYGFY